MEGVERMTEAEEMELLFGRSGVGKEGLGMDLNLYTHASLLPGGGGRAHTFKPVPLPEHVDWSSEKNPLGRSVVSPPINQGHCGGRFCACIYICVRAGT